MKQVDVLKRFVQEHKEEFNDRKVPENTWSAIKARMDRASFLTWSIFNVLVIIGLIIWLTLYNLTFEKAVSEPEELLEYALYHDFLEMEKYYLTKSVDLQNEINLFINDATLQRDLSLLDQINEDLKEELLNTKGPYKEQVILALIQNQQVKLQLLENILEDIRKNKNQPNEILESI